MSHFTVAVLSYSPEDVESLLAPFCESTDNPEYLEFVTTEEPMAAIRAMYENEGGMPDETLEQFVSRYYGYTYNEELDECGYICNPNAKWDWWMIGGRWEGLLPLRPNCEGYLSENRKKVSQGGCDQALLSDIDLTPDQEAYDKALRFWQVHVEGDSIRDDENPDDFRALYRKEYYLDQFGDKQTYATECASFSPWALVTPDGEWIQKGEMGWFGVGDSTCASRKAYNAQLEAELKAHPDLWITLVDCHI